ncbi:MAG: MFS transporter, partial [Pseudomonadales bacterium]|nr:MFS transporter [Pseudomonadales bacterium]
MRSPRQILFAFYWNGCVRDIIPIYPLYAVMFIDHGVSPLGLSVLLALWATVAFVFEIPSGAWADRFSRKWLIVIGAVIKGAAFIAWWLRPDFFGFALGFFFWGFGSTLRSGAWEALLHDTLKSWGREQEFGRRYGQATGLATFGVVIADLAGGLLIVFGYDLVLL